jgi:hypothetical protein
MITGGSTTDSQSPRPEAVMLGSAESRICALLTTSSVDHSEIPKRPLGGSKRRPVSEKNARRSSASAGVYPAYLPDMQSRTLTRNGGGGLFKTAHYSKCFRTYLVECRFRERCVQQPKVGKHLGDGRDCSMRRGRRKRGCRSEYNPAETR